MEEEAIEEGASVDDVRRLAALTLEVFKASMDKKPLEVPHWHPLHIQEEEHVDMANKVALMKAQVHALLHGAEGAARAAAIAKLRSLIEYFGKAESNFLKQENVYFPLLERHGIAQPPKIMWAEHDLMRAAQKRLASLAAAIPREAAPSNGPEAETAAVRDVVLEFEGLLLDHIMKERTILFRPRSSSSPRRSGWTSAASSTASAISRSIPYPATGNALRPTSFARRVKKRPLVLRMAKAPSIWIPATSPETSSSRC